MALKAKVDQNKCLGCAACTSVCGTGAITIDGSGRACVDCDKCIGCQACSGICPAGAIEFEDK